MMQNNTAEGQFAPLYDLVFNPFLNQVHKKVVQIVKKYDCQNIIDLGSGTGQQARILAVQGVSVTGVDASRNMIELARKKSPSSVRFIHDSIESVDLNDSCFDAAILSLVLHPNAKEGIYNIIEKTLRLVKSDGKIVITDYGLGTGFSGRLANLLVKGIESCADKHHRNNYFHFMKNNVFELISSHPHLRILEEWIYFHGALQTKVYSSFKEEKNE